MSSEPLIDVIPLLKRPADGAMITQFDYPTCEALGLIKMDFLGLRNLTVLDDAVKNIKANRGETVVLEDLDARRPGDLRPAPARRHPRRLPARRRPDAGAAALDAARQASRTSPPSARSTGPARWVPTPTTSTPAARPAASRSSRSTPSWPSRSRTILGETYGLIVYQEQVMAIAQKLAGYTLGQADLLRRAMGKKKKEELDKQFEGFSGGMIERGYSMTARQDALGHPAAVLRLRVQQGALRGVRPGVLLDRLPQGQLPGRVHGRAADLAPRTTRTSRRSTSTSAAG